MVAHWIWKDYVSYAVGHVYNDICASMWFSYLLIFYENVCLFSPVAASNLLLIGQIVDGLAQPVVGYFSDKTNGFFGYSNRKSWHALGTVLVTCSFPLVFHRILLGSGDPNSVGGFMNYVPWIVLFQIGWATTQINHLPMIPELTSCQHKRDTLNSMRFAALIAANIYTYLMMWLLLHLSGTNLDDPLGPAQMVTFENMAYIACGTGLVFTGIFHLGVKENVASGDVDGAEASSSNSEAETDRGSVTGMFQLGVRENLVNHDGAELMEQIVHIAEASSSDSVAETDNATPNQKATGGLTVACWLRRPDFYFCAVAYMCSRMVLNSIRVFGPFYITYTLSGLNQTWIAILPLIQYVSGFVSTVLVKVVSKKYGIKYAYIIGAVITIAGNIWAIWVQDSSIWQVFCVFILFGLGSNAIACSALALINEMIGLHTTAAGFVFGFLSLAESAANGGGVVLVESLAPLCSGSVNITDHQECYFNNTFGVVDEGARLKESYYRNFMSYGVATIAAIGIVGLVVKTFLAPKDIVLVKGADNKGHSE